MATSRMQYHHPKQTSANTWQPPTLMGTPDNLRSDKHRQVDLVSPVQESRKSHYASKTCILVSMNITKRKKMKCFTDV